MLLKLTTNFFILFLTLFHTLFLPYFSYSISYLQSSGMYIYVNKGPFDTMTTHGLFSLQKRKVWPSHLRPIEGSTPYAISEFGH